MPKPRQQIGIRTLLGWGISGQLVYVASQFVTLLCLTRFATVQEVGIYGLASAVVIPVFFFFTLGTRINVASSAQSGYSFHDFRALLLISTSVGFGLIVLIGFTAFSGSARAILLILGASKLAESISDLCYGVFQRHDRMSLVAGSLILRSVTGTAFFALLLVNGTTVELAFLAQFIVWAVVALAVDHPRARRLWREQGGKLGTDAARVIALTKASLPLGLNGLLSALQGNMPRYVIIWLLDVVALGHFTVVGYAMQAISTVMMAAMQSLISRFNSYIEGGQFPALIRTLKKLLTTLALFGVASVGLSLLLGDWLVQEIFGPNYADLGRLLAICVLAASLRAVVLILQTCMLAGRLFTRNLMIRVGSSTAMLLCCLAGGMAGGLTGIAWGMCVAFCLHIAALALAVRSLVIR